MTQELPTGTVTFLFTDVEGSTRLLAELGAERYAEALGEHRAVIRAALSAHGGVEVDTQGDSFFCVFRSARSAVACAAGIGAALTPTPVRVRVGVHTGEALVVDRHYVGMDVHRAARIGACGHGGQVVVSPTTVPLLEPGDFFLTDLGEHRLKDLSAPVRIHQLGNERFPPLKTLFRTNLPIPATAFLGREEELRDLVERGSEPGVRVLTLTGPGGTGKTRLGLQLAAELSGSYPDGVWWVPLATLREGLHVASALANVLEVEEESARALGASIAAALERKKALVLLDNCEHLVDAVATLTATLVAGCPDLLILATSREALAVTGEHVFPVEPLTDTDALELFFARAKSAGAQLDEVETRGVVAALCDRLDHLPLAVELAAARAAALPPAALLERLSSGLDVLKGPRDVEERQRTLRATIAWSHGLLEETEQRLFRRLAVFVGGGSLSAIEEVCDADLEDLLSLVAKSLVRQAPVDGDEPRYWMLETIREFAVEQFAAGDEDADDLRSAHCEWFTGLAREVRDRLDGPESGEWLARVEPDLANLRAAFAWAVVQSSAADAVVLASLLAAVHGKRGRYAEAEDVLRTALHLDPSPREAAALGDVLGRVLRLHGRPAEALDVFRAALRALEAEASRGADWWKVWVDLELSLAHFFYFQNDRDELEKAIAEVEPAIAEHGTPEQQLELLHVHAQHLYRKERYALSEDTEERVRAVHRRSLELGDVSADFTLGFCLLWRGKLEEAETYLGQGVERARSRGDALMETRSLVYQSVARRRRDDLEGARALVRGLQELDELHGYRGLVAANAAWIAYRDRDLEQTSVRGDEALEDWETEGRIGSSVFQWAARFPLLGVAVARGRVDAALDHARAMLDDSQQPLPEEVAAALSQAVERGSAELLERALELARPGGYA